MNGVLVLTISGQDRAGLVEKLADVIAEHGGNWEHCRMAHLAGRFVGLLEVTVTGNQQQDLESALRGISDLDVMIAPGLATSEMEPMRQFDLEVVGSDHPGIVRDVFRALAQVSNQPPNGSTTLAHRDNAPILPLHGRHRVVLHHMRHIQGLGFQSST